MRPLKILARLPARLSRLKTRSSNIPIPVSTEQLLSSHRRSAFRFILFACLFLFSYLTSTSLHIPPPITAFTITKPGSIQSPPFTHPLEHYNPFTTHQTSKTSNNHDGGVSPVSLETGFIKLQETFAQLRLKGVNVALRDRVYDNILDGYNLRRYSILKGYGRWMIAAYGGTTGERPFEFSHLF
jgi:hypothetical protein